MLGEHEQEYLVQAFAAGRMNLFLGAGFSAGATSLAGKSVPTGWGLLELLWTELGFKGVPSSSDKLSEIFPIAVEKLGPKRMTELLKKHLSIKSHPDWMKIVSSIYWRTIYSTNIDDIVQTLYRASGVQSLSPVDGTIDELRDRDSGMQKLNYIQLHGSIQSPLEALTFGVQQYAGRANQKYDPWYTELTSEFCNCPMIFVGSQFEEPIFWQYLESRGAKRDSTTNPKSFLVSKSISELKRKTLESLNILPIETTAEEFFLWLDKKLMPRPTRAEIIRMSAPHLLVTIESEARAQNPRIATHLQEFLSYFKVYAPISKDSGHARTAFLSGAIPTIQDIAHGLDAARDMTAVLKELLNSKTRKPNQIIVVHGQSGAGKSTMARRLAWDLAAEGRLVLFNESGHFPSVACVSKALSAFDKRPILIIDDSHKSARPAAQFVRTALSEGIDAQIICFSRSGSVTGLLDALETVGEVVEMPVQDLSRKEIESLIDVLDRNGMLGRLQGLTPDKRIYEFEVRAKKQILVAMKEATAGRGFGEIIKEDYDQISSKEARDLYLLTSLITSHGQSTPKTVLIGAFGLEPSHSLSLIRRDLRGLIVDVDGTGERFIARHEVIAEHIVSEVADPEHLKAVYVETLNRLSTLMSRSRDPKSRVYKLYKTMIRHEALFRRFGKDQAKQVREIYDSVKDQCTNDHHFWLQYSNFELTVRRTQLAETYINSAISILKESGRQDYYVDLTLAKITLNRAIFEISAKPEAMHLRDECFQRLEEIISANGAQNPYPFHVFAFGIKLWAQQRETDSSEQMKLIKRARRVVDQGLRIHPKNHFLKQLEKDLRESEMLIAGGLDWKLSEADLTVFLEKLS